MAFSRPIKCFNLVTCEGTVKKGTTNLCRSTQQTGAEHSK